MPFSLSYGLKPQPMVTTNMDMAVTNHKGTVIVKRDRIAEDRRRLKNFIDGAKYQGRDHFISTMK